MGAGGGVRSAPSRLFQAPSHLWLPKLRVPTRHQEGRASRCLPASCASPGRSHFYATACDRLFRFCRLRQFAPTFPLKLPFFLPPSSLLARSVRPSPAFFFFSSSFATTTTLVDAHPPKPRAGRASGGSRSGVRGGAGAVAQRGWGWSRGATAELKSGSGERLAAGSRARERLNVEFCLGTTCQQKRRLKTRAGAIYRHPRRRGRGAALASHCSICSAHPTQADFGITLTMWEFFFRPHPHPSAHG